MKRIKSESEKRLIVKATVNGKDAYFLIDTGACVGLIDDGAVKKYDLIKGKRYPGTIIGAGGEELRNVRYCNTFAHFEGKIIPQFLITDISEIIESIEHDTNIKIIGIISLPQMKIAGLGVDANDNDIIVE